jgi:hypothetical protein
VVEGLGHWRALGIKRAVCINNVLYKESVVLFTIFKRRGSARKTERWSLSDLRGLTKHDPGVFDITIYNNPRYKRVKTPVHSQNDSNKQSQPLNARETAQHLIVSAQCSSPSLCPPT